MSGIISTSGRVAPIPQEYTVLAIYKMKSVGSVPSGNGVETNKPAVKPRARRTSSIAAKTIIIAKNLANWKEFTLVFWNSKKSSWVLPFLIKCLSLFFVQSAIKMKIKKANGGFVVNNGKRKGVNVMTPSELKTLRVIDPASNKIGIKANSLKIVIFFPWKNLLGL